MLGTLGFKNVRVDCIIGELPSERERAQPIFLDVEVKADIARPIETDDLKDAVDYVALSELCAEIARQKKCRLLEKLAGEMIDGILNRFPVTYAKVRIKKPGGMERGDYAFIEAEKSKE